MNFHRHTFELAAPLRFGFELYDGRVETCIECGHECQYRIDAVGGIWVDMSPHAFMDGKVKPLDPVEPPSGRLPVSTADRYVHSSRQP